jgi:hypothetical protein
MMTALSKLQKILNEHKPDGLSTRVKHDTELKQAVESWASDIMCGSLIEKIYCFVHQMNELPKCLCGNPVRFISITQGYREFCSKTCNYAKQVATRRRVESMKANGGVGLSNPKSKQKAQQTLFDTYGISNAFCSPNANEKRTNQNPMQDPTVILSIRQQCLKDHGVDWHSKRTDVIHKKTNTNLTKYGVINSSQKHYTKHTCDVLQNSQSLKTMFQTNTIEQISQNLGVCETTILKYLKLYGIRLPNEIAPEIQLMNWLIDQGFIDFHKSRTVLTSKQEIDLYSDSQKLGIEYCGLFWHSQKYKTRSYHRNKYNECMNQGIKLVTIFEDEWLNKRNIVISRLSQLLGINTTGCGARKLRISLINRLQAEMFLNKYHISGSASASVFVGAYNMSGELVAVMTFSRGRRFNKPKHEWEWEMIRFCTDGSHYPGVASRLFKYFVSQHSPSSVISYADLRWGQGDYLKHLGFIRYEDSPPNYWYFSLSNTNFKRYHRFTFCKQALLKKFPGSDPNLSEYNLAQNNGLERIWDCGNATWIWRDHNS